jgi:hypothetical protein
MGSPHTSAAFFAIAFNARRARSFPMLDKPTRQAGDGRSCAPSPFTGRVRPERSVTLQTGDMGNTFCIVMPVACAEDRAVLEGNPNAVASKNS